jgi:hypothetical protein
LLLGKEVTIRKRYDLDNQPWQIDYLTDDHFDAHLCDDFREAFELYVRLWFGMRIDE